MHGSGHILVASLSCCWPTRKTGNGSAQYQVTLRRRKGFPAGTVGQVGDCCFLSVKVIPGKGTIAGLCARFG